MESSGESALAPQQDASTSAFLTAGRAVNGPCLNKDIPPYQPPVPDPDGRLAQAQLAGAQLVSNALVRSFLRSEYPLDSLTEPPPCIVQWCQETDQPFQNFPPLAAQSLTLAAEWAYDRTVSRLLFDHDYVRKLPIDPFDAQKLVGFLSKTRRNDQQNVARHRGETLRHDSHDYTHDEDAPHNALVETCAAPLPAAERDHLFHATLAEMCDLLHLERITGEILFQYYTEEMSRAEIKRTYGVTIEAVKRRMTRAIKRDPVRGAQAQAAFQDYLTAMQCHESVSPRKRSRPEKVKADEDDTSLYASARGWRGRDFPTLPKRRSPDAQEE
jgi:hypothetical protein